MVRVPPSPAEPPLAPSYRVSVTRADGEANGGWVAQVEGFPDSSGRGDTPEEAIGRSMSALSDGVAEASAEVAPGEEAPAGEAPAEEAKAEATSSRSGRLLVRMPATLHDELANAAGAEGVSLNQLITGILAGAVSWRGDEGTKVGLRGADSTSRSSAGSAGEADSGRLMRIALAVNLGAVVVAAVAAIVLIVIAWQHGW